MSVSQNTYFPQLSLLYQFNVWHSRITVSFPSRQQTFCLYIRNHSHFGSPKIEEPRANFFLYFHLIGPTGVNGQGGGKMGSVDHSKPMDPEPINQLHYVKEGSFQQNLSRFFTLPILPKTDPFYPKLIHFTPVDPACITSWKLFKQCLRIKIFQKTLF